MIHSLGVNMTTYKDIVKFPKHCTLMVFENILHDISAIAKKTQEIWLDFSEVEVIGVFQVSILYGIISRLNNSKKLVKVIWDNEKGGTSGILKKLNFDNELKDIGIEVREGAATKILSGIAAFKHFKNVEEFQSYEKALGDIDTSERLLGGGVEADIIRDGDFRDTLLHELIENAFLHGNGKLVRYGVLEYGQGKREPHPFLASFGSERFLELVVSDSGKGLLNALTAPFEYTPFGTFEITNMSDGAMTIPYSFEFNSTGDKEARKKRIKKIYEAADNMEVCDAIPTGLFYVGILTKIYGGQIIVRTKQILVSIDFSKSSKPIITSYKLPRNKKLVAIDGTHVMVRVPKKRNVILPIEHPKAPQKTLRNISKAIVSLSDSVSDLSSPEDYHVKIENDITNTLVSAEQNKIQLVCIMCDGLHVDTKLFSIMLTIIAIIPRRDRALMLLGVKKEYLDSAKEQWKRINALVDVRTRLLDKATGYRSYLLVGEDLVDIVEYGETGHYDSTQLVNDHEPKSQFEYDRLEVQSIYKSCLVDVISKKINTHPVKHPYHQNRYYLIEGKYYCQIFYEIRKLFSSRNNYDLLSNYFRFLFKEHGITHVLNISEPLDEFIVHLEKKAPEILFHKMDYDSARYAYMIAEAKCKEKENMALLADVTCSTNEMLSYLNMSSRLDNILVACLVDARSEEHGYITVKREDKAYSITIAPILTMPVVPSYDLPKGRRVDVILIDTKTHAPTTYDQIEAPRITPEILTEKARECCALVYGHYSLQHKHYTHFLQLDRLFSSMRHDLEAWWDSILARMRDLNYLKKDITVYYLDEQKGWEKIFESYISVKGIEKFIRIDRTELYAPPEGTETRERGISWFIIPVLASGDTTWQCLEYASRLSKTTIFVCVILSRIDSTRLSYYQNITGYGNKEVYFETLTYLPLTASPKNLCHKCEIENIFDNLHPKVENYPVLSTIIEEKRKQFQLIDVATIVTYPYLEDSQINKVKMRIRYEEGLKKYDRRKDFAALIDKTDGVLMFLEMVGEEFVSDKYKMDKLERTAHIRMEYIKKNTNAYLRKEQPKLSLLSILGIHRVLPEILRREFKQLVNFSQKNPSTGLLEDLIALSLMFPADYGYMIVSSNLEQKIGTELKKYPFWGREKLSNDSVEAFNELLWLLRRSTPWGSNLEILRASVIARASDEVIRNAYVVYSTQGIDGVLNNICKLQALDQRSKLTLGGNIWSDLVRHYSKINNIPSEVESMKYSLDSIMLESASEIQQNEVLTYLESLDNKGGEIVSIMESMFINPLEVKVIISELKSTKWPNVNVIIDVAPDQPGVFFTIELMILALTGIIDNAEDRVNSFKSRLLFNTDEYYIRISFNGFTVDKLASEMTVSDNIPWDSDIKPTGGLLTTIKCCDRYNALCNIDPSSSSCKISVVFMIDDKKRGMHAYE